MSGLLERLFGPPRPVARDYRQGPKLAGLDPVAERAVALQKHYWTSNPDELAMLEARRFETLDSRELLRLHHLRCLALLDARDGLLRRGLLAPIAERPSEAELRAAIDPTLHANIERSAKALLSRRSLHRPRHAFTWLGAAAPTGDQIPYSDLQGRTLNASLTHLGALEVIGLDDAFEPARVELIGFDQILTISLAASSAAAPFRPARILREYGLEDRVVLVPMRYGLSWFAHEPELLRGTAEHQVAAIELGGLAQPNVAGSPTGSPLDRRALGIAVGAQRLEVLSDYFEDGVNGVEDGVNGLSRFCLADAYQISFAIDQDDPKFAEKCRGRGIDPEATRGDVVRETRLRASARAKRQG